MNSTQPWMVFQLTDRVWSQSMLRFSPDKSINKICSLVAPSLRYLTLPKLNIFCQHQVSNLISRSSIVRTSACHQLISYDSDGKIIWDETMVHSAYNFRSWIVTYVHIYPGVPLVSQLLLALYILAIPKSVILMYPLESRTKFSGLISRWMMLFFWRSSRPRIMQAMKNSK